MYSFRASKHFGDVMPMKYLGLFRLRMLLLHSFLIQSNSIDRYGSNISLQILIHLLESIYLYLSDFLSQTISHASLCHIQSAIHNLLLKSISYPIQFRFQQFFRSHVHPDVNNGLVLFLVCFTMIGVLFF
jgi:hypothetical protein